MTFRHREEKYFYESFGIKVRDISNFKESSKHHVCNKVKREIRHLPDYQIERCIRYAIITLDYRRVRYTHTGDYAGHQPWISAIVNVAGVFVRRIPRGGFRDIKNLEDAIHRTKRRMNNVDDAFKAARLARAAAATAAGGAPVPVPAGGAPVPVPAAPVPVPAGGAPVPVPADGAPVPVPAGGAPVPVPADGAPVPVPAGTVI